MIIRYRKHSLFVEISQKKIYITSEKVSALPIRIAYKDQFYHLKEGETLEIKLGSA